MQIYVILHLRAEECLSHAGCGGRAFRSSHQVLEHQCERLVRVDDIVQRHDVGMFQILQ